VRHTRVAVVTNYWRNSDGGGIRTYLVGLVDELRIKGIDVRVIFREGEDPENFKIGGSRFLFPLPAFLHLWRLRPKVVHSQGTWYCLLAGVLYKKLNGCRLIHTFHTEPVDDLPAGFKFIFKLLLDQCDCMTFVSIQLEKQIREVWGLGFKRTAITYAGVGVKDVSEQEVSAFKERFGIQDRSPVLLAQALTAHINKAEGLKILMKALKVVRKEYPEVVLLATREGKYTPELREFARKEGLEDAVIFTGDVDNPYVPLNVCDVFTYASLGGGLSIALLEAMSMGKPIITCSVGGSTEAIEDGHNGLLAAPDPYDIAAKIGILLKDKGYAAMLGENARRTVEERFTWDKAAERFIELFKS